MITQEQLKAIIKQLEINLTHKPIGTKLDSDLVISLTEDAQSTLLSEFCTLINMGLEHTRLDSLLKRGKECSF